MKRVYVAGPYTGGDVERNVKRAMDVADALTAAGHAPFVPHLYHFLRKRSYDDWLRIDMAWLEKSDVMVRIPGKSKGADVEELRAKELGVPVLHLEEGEVRPDWSDVGGLMLLKWVELGGKVQ
jgi:hypothetical protein